MEKLTIKELAPYLPYGLKVLSERGTVYELDVYYNMMGSGIEKRDLYSVLENGMKPILRPLSQLTEEIEHNGKKFVPIDEIRKMSDVPYSKSFRFEEDGFKFTTQLMHSEYGNHQWLDYDFYSNNQYEMYNKLFEWHFDTANLLGRGLALPIDGKEVEGE